jgi:hypothetical protein
MSAYEKEKLAHAFMFGDLLSADLRDTMIENRCENVTDNNFYPVFGNPNLTLVVSAGMYHYAQGMWVTCDSASEWALENLEENSTMEQFNAQCGVDPTPIIRHSVGVFGMYVWYISRTNITACSCTVGPFI